MEGEEVAEIAQSPQGECGKPSQAGQAVGRGHVPPIRALQRKEEAGMPLLQRKKRRLREPKGGLLGTF